MYSITTNKMMDGFLIKKSKLPLNNNLDCVTEKMRLIFTLFILFALVSNSFGQDVLDSLFEDIQFEKAKTNGEPIFFTSPNVDFLQISSTITDSVKFAIVVYKPLKPSPILLLSHGWHMSVKPPTKEAQNPDKNFLTVQVDMRGRKYSTGKQDCNGYELYDFYDAYNYVIKYYQSYISDPTQVYYSGSSGGGGNGFALVGKFPDLFCSANIGCGISDYVEWYNGDSIGEFRDEMLLWIGFSPKDNPEAYASRSGITTVQNILTPTYITHGETDVRVPVTHARRFVQKAKELDKEIHYLELKNVGTRSHWGKITREQEIEKREFQANALSYKSPPVLPEKGRLIVAGYIVTKHFSVFLNSINSVCEIEYDQLQKKVKFIDGKGEIIWHR